MRCTALILFALLATGCGGDEPDDDAVPRTAPQPAAGPAADTMGGDTTVPGVVGAQADERPGRNGDAGVADQERLYTVQVAAFLEASSAAEWTDRLERQGLPVWASVGEVGGRTFHRVRVGAVPSVGEARRLGALITERYEWPVWVTRLTPADRVPDDAARETRQLLGAG